MPRARDQSTEIRFNTGERRRMLEFVALSISLGSPFFSRQPFGSAPWRPYKRILPNCPHSEASLAAEFDRLLRGRIVADERLWDYDYDDNLLVVIKQVRLNLKHRKAKDFLEFYRAKWNIRLHEDIGIILSYSKRPKTVHLNESSLDPAAMCIICFENVIETARKFRHIIDPFARGTNCDHLECYECLEKWEQRTPTCPICRKPLGDRTPIHVKLDKLE